MACIIFRFRFSGSSLKHAMGIALGAGPNSSRASHVSETIPCAPPMLACTLWTKTAAHLIPMLVSHSFSTHPVQLRTLDFGRNDQLLWMESGSTLNFVRIDLRGERSAMPPARVLLPWQLHCQALSCELTHRCCARCAALWCRPGLPLLGCAQPTHYGG